MTFLVFSDDWGRHPSSCQYLIRQLLPKNLTVWVNTIGMRRPKFEWYTVTRGYEKIKQWFGPKPPAEVLPKNLKVVSPVVWPGFGNRLERSLNARLMAKQLRPIVAGMSEPPIAITTIPTVADLIGKIEVKKWIYYCVDDFATWPGLDQRAIAQMENKLIEKADRIIVVSENLQGRVATSGRTSQLLTHGVDLPFWKEPLRHIPWAFDVPRPWIVFWGLIDRRMDVEFLEQLSAANIGSIILAGPEDNPDPRIKTLSRLYCIGPLRPDQLPGLAAEAAVLILPYADLPVTRAIQPLKLKEYLATGRPVVARSLPAVREWFDALDSVDDVEQFVEIVHRRIDSGTPATQAAARQRLEAESWSAKAEQFARIVCDS